MGKLLDELLVLVQLLEVVNRHAIKAVVLGTVKIVLVTKNAVNFKIPVSKSIHLQASIHLPYSFSVDPNIPDLTTHPSPTKAIIK